MPTIVVAASQEAIAAVPADFEENLKMLEELYLWEGALNGQETA
jgi:hypothetical protein